MISAAPLAVGVDLGSTAIKAGVLDAEGRLTEVRSVPAPPLRGSGRIREGDARAYADAAQAVLRAMGEQVPAGTPLGLATQRSTFTVWDRRDGRPLLPLISWQDRRAADWCERNRAMEREIVRRTGLLLSAHYLGPKLAAMRESDASFAAVLRSGQFVLGTLETFLIWHWSAGARHETDVTVAARTLMLDLARDDWSPELLERFGVPANVLPAVVPTTGRRLPLADGLELTATLSDQAAAALAVFDRAREAALVNLGTGAFVLCPTDRSDVRRAGYLLAPVLAGANGERRYALEGTVNGAGPAVDACGPGPTGLPESDPSPSAFAVPDRAGLGSPYWRPDIGLTLSPAAERLEPSERRRIVLEGVLFRIRQILDDLCGTAYPQRILAGGGLTRDPAVGPGLAALLGRPVELLLERESGLLGASRLAAGLAPYADPPTETVEPGPRGCYLRAKYPEWRRWVEALLANDAEPS
jgi:glycerol kinase